MLYNNFTSSASVLIVDDDEFVRCSLSLGLKAAGLRAEEATDGKQALRKLRVDRFDWLVTDVIMPENDGFQLLRVSRELYPELKIVAISGGGLISAANYLRIARRLGASHVLQKPFLYTQLAMLISNG